MYTGTRLDILKPNFPYATYAKDMYAGTLVRRPKLFTLDEKVLLSILEQEGKTKWSEPIFAKITSCVIYLVNTKNIVFYMQIIENHVYWKIWLLL